MSIKSIILLGAFLGTSACAHSPKDSPPPREISLTTEVDKNTIMVEQVSIILQKMLNQTDSPILKHKRFGLMFDGINFTPTKHSNDNRYKIRYRSKRGHICSQSVIYNLNEEVYLGRHNCNFSNEN